MEELTNNLLFEDNMLLCLTTDREIKKTHWLFIFEDEDYITIDNLDYVMENIENLLSKISDVNSFMYQIEIVSDTQRVYINATISFIKANRPINKIKNFILIFILILLKKQV